MNPTPTTTRLDLNLCEFANLREALDYAAQGETGYNFYDRRGRPTAVVSYARLRDEALATAARLRSLGLPAGSRVALVAETQPDFLYAFFGCQYAGLVPVTLPMSIHAGSHEQYVSQLRSLLGTCEVSVALASDGFSPYLLEAAAGLDMRFVGTHGELRERSAGDERVVSAPAELAYIQYTSGSTRFPRGAMVDHHALTANLRGILEALEFTPDDRCSSWLPLYHDMGLIGLLLSPMVAQRSVDFLPTHDFVMAPLQWLSLISENRATISFSPPLGYELCTRRMRRASGLDLSSWRVAGVGAEQIRPATLADFADAFRPSGFDARAFLPSYGMAECTLAVSFPPIGRGVGVDRVDIASLELGDARPSTAAPGGQEAEGVRSLAECGQPLPGHEIEIRDEDGRTLPDRRVGGIFVRGPSTMTGYFQDPDATRAVLAPDGWLDTGDMGYWTGESLVISGRKKDLIIIRGRNISPTDLEALTEQELGLRMGNALAFATEGPEGGDEAVIVVQSRVAEPEERAELARRLQRSVRKAFGFDCLVDFVPPGFLPRTSSGKLSRTAARRQYEERNRSDVLIPQPPPSPAKAGPPHVRQRTHRTTSP